MHYIPTAIYPPVHVKSQKYSFNTSRVITETSFADGRKEGREMKGLTEYFIRWTKGKPKVGNFELDIQIT